MTETEPQRYVYAGKVLTATNTLVHAWLPEDQLDEGKLKLFTKAKGSVIGGVYRIDVDSDGTTYVPGSVTYLAERVDRDIVIELEARSRADGVQHARRLMERNDARSSEIRELCEPLRDVVKRQVGWANRSAMIAFITAEITR